MRFMILMIPGDKKVEAGILPDGKLIAAMMKYNAELNTVMTERFNVAGALLVKLFGRPKQESREFNDAASRVADIGVKRAMTGMGFSLLLPFVGAIGTAMAYWWGGHRLIDGTITTGTIVALASYLTRLYGPLGELAGARVDFVTAFVSFDRVFEVLDAKPLITEREGARSLDKASLAGEIRFDGVRFRYPAPDEVSVKSLESGTSAHSGEPSALVLDGVSFAVATGTLTALVGPSGAGKTTLAQLIPRLYDVTEGSVLLDGIDVRDLTFASLVDAIGVVSQDAHLFHDTIAANLRYARPDATQEQIIAAAQAAQIHDMIASLPDGYDTMVGERGYRLSGGEKQRLAIARVLLKDPRIVILDEATAHLDSETEVQIAELRRCDARFLGQFNRFAVPDLRVREGGPPPRLVCGGMRMAEDALRARDRPRATKMARDEESVRGSHALERLGDPQVL